MANSEAWTNLTAIGRHLYIQKYAIEEIESLEPKNGSKISPEEAEASIDRLRKLHNLFTYNQDEVNKNIDPSHRSGQLALTDRIRRKVTSYLSKFEKILVPDEPAKTIEFPQNWISSEKLEDWIAYEDYLVLKQRIRDFNILCSSIPQDILPTIQQLKKEGATDTEIEDIVSKIRSNIAFDNIIEAEIQKLETYPLYNDDNKDEFAEFAKMAKQATRILRVFHADEESNSEKFSWMVHRVTEKFPAVVKNKWRKEISQLADEPLVMKLTYFLSRPVDLLFQDDNVWRWRWIRDILNKISNKFLTRFRA